MRKDTEPGRRLYFTARWQALRAIVLRQRPLCVSCELDGRTAPAGVVDHYEPHNGDEAAFWRGPFVSLCHSCHTAKTAREMGRGHFDIDRLAPHAISRGGPGANLGT